MPWTAARARAWTGVGLAAVLVTGSVSAPAAAETGLIVTVSEVLTLPASDGFHDSVTVTVTAGAASTVELAVLGAAGQVVEQLPPLPLTDQDGDGRAEASITLSATDFPAGSYSVRATAPGSVAGTAALLVGTGEIRVVNVGAADDTLYPWPDGIKDAASATVTAMDETGAQLPFDGTVTLASGTQSASAPVSSVDGTAGEATVSAVRLPLGTATLTASLRGPAGEALTSAGVDVALRPTALAGATVTASATTVAPARDGLHDSISFTVAGWGASGDALPVTGEARLSLAGTTVKTWTVTPTSTAFAWDGRTGGTIVAGLYAVSVTVAGAQGAPTTATTSFTVSSKSLATISGKVRDGAVVAAAVADPGWGGAAGTAAYQWLLDGAAITGATTSSLTVAPSMVGHDLAVQVATTLAGSVRTGTSEARPVYAGAASERSLEQKLRSLIATLPGDYTVRVIEIDHGGRSVSIGGGSPHEPASSVKLFIAYAVYTKIDAGTLAYSTQLPSGHTVAKCLRAMIEPSDNYCAIELRNKVTMPYLNKLIDAGGYVDTHFWYSGGRTKVSSATDLARLIARLADGRLLSKKSTAAFLALLQTQVWREAIPPGLPFDVKQASKPGTLWEYGGMTQSDVAFVWGKKTRYSIAVMGYHGATIPSITKISKLVYTELQGKFSTAFVYNPQQMKATAALTLRAGAGMSAKAITTFPSGTKVEVIDSTYDWYLVKVGGRTGWVPNTHLVLRSPVN